MYYTKNCFHGKFQKINKQKILFHYNPHSNVCRSKYKGNEFNPQTVNGSLKCVWISENLQIMCIQIAN